MKAPKDPIVEEIHAIREAIAKTSGNDMDRIAEAARARQAKGVSVRPIVATMFTDREPLVFAS